MKYIRPVILYDGPQKSITPLFTDETCTAGNIFRVSTPALDPVVGPLKYSLTHRVSSLPPSLIDSLD